MQSYWRRGTLFAFGNILFASLLQGGCGMDQAQVGLVELGSHDHVFAAKIALDRKLHRLGDPSEAGIYRAFDLAEVLTYTQTEYESFLQERVPAEWYVLYQALDLWSHVELYQNDSFKSKVSDYDSALEALFKSQDYARERLSMLALYRFASLEETDDFIRAHFSMWRSLLLAEDESGGVVGPDPNLSDTLFASSPRTIDFPELDELTTIYAIGTAVVYRDRHFLPRLAADLGTTADKLLLTLSHLVVDPSPRGQSPEIAKRFHSMRAKLGGERVGVVPRTLYYSPKTGTFSLEATEPLSNDSSSYRWPYRVQVLGLGVVPDTFSNGQYHKADAGGTGIDAALHRASVDQAQHEAFGPIRKIILGVVALPFMQHRVGWSVQTRQTDLYWPTALVIRLVPGTQDLREGDLRAYLNKRSISAEAQASLEHATTETFRSFGTERIDPSTSWSRDHTLLTHSALLGYVFGRALRYRTHFGLNQTTLLGLANIDYEDTALDHEFDEDAFEQSYLEETSHRELRRRWELIFPNWQPGYQEYRLLKGVMNQARDAAFDGEDLDHMDSPPAGPNLIQRLVRENVHAFGAMCR